MQTVTKLFVFVLAIISVCECFNISIDLRRQLLCSVLPGGRECTFTEKVNYRERNSEKEIQRSQPNYCGIGFQVVNSTPKSINIVGGHEAEMNQFPWHVAIEEESHEEFAYTGGGAILNERWIVSAAHVFPGRQINSSNYRGIIGTVNLNDLNLTVTFDKIIRHPNFTSSTYENDIALLHTSEPMELYPKFKHTNSICLPKRNTRSLSFFVTGFGKNGTEEQHSEKLLYVKLRWMGSKRCQALYKSFNPKMMMCGGDLKGKKDSCFGDSGGPAFVDLKRSYLVGIVSFGKSEGCALKGVPAVYTRVTEYLDWIHETMGP